MVPEVSVIIPVYNVEKYLRHCLNSVINQTLKEIEILCVNDCSPDNSTAILEEYAERDSRIKVINHNENTGQGGARNTGIREAQADFIVLPDSDDWLEPDYVEKLYTTAVETEADVVQCEYRSFDDETGKYRKYHKGKYHEVKKEEKEEYLFTIFPNAAPWNRIYRKSIFKEGNIQFPHHLYYQDLAVIYQIEYHAMKIVSLPVPLYNYRIRSNSITTSNSSKHIEDYFKVFTLIRAFLKEKDLIDNQAVFSRYTNVLNHQFFDRCFNYFVLAGEPDTQKTYIHHFYECLGRYFEQIGLQSLECRFHTKESLEQIQTFEKLNIKTRRTLVLLINKWYHFLSFSRKKRGIKFLLFPFKRLLRSYRAKAGG